jgi:hypothetical protein
MAKNTLLVAGPKLQKKLRDLSNGVTNVDLTASIKTSKKQEIISSSKKNVVYDGFFAVVVADEKISVIDGSDPSSETAGYYYINGKRRLAKKTSGIALKTGWLCLKDSNIGQNGEFEIVDTVPSKPETTGGYDYHAIAYISKNGDAFSIRQVSKWETPQLWTFEDCDSEEGDQ